MSDMNRRHFLMSSAVLAGSSAVRGLASANSRIPRPGLTAES
jgi:hypothetical protein